MRRLKLHGQATVYILRRSGLLRLQLLDLEALEHAKVHHFLPLREDEVVLLEVLPQQLYRCLSVLHDNFAVFVVLGRLVQVPPPAALLEDLEQERRVIASANEATVGLEQEVEACLPELALAREHPPWALLPLEPNAQQQQHPVRSRALALPLRSPPAP